MRLAPLLAWVCLAGVSVAQTTLNPDEARIAAARLLVGGQAQAAADITTVLLKRDAQDTTGLLIHAQAMRTLKRYPEAQKAARQAWASAKTDQDRYGASITMAQALSSEGKKTRAQIWLRRATHVAPTPALRARAIRDYGFVRKTNPWSVNLSFAVTPSDNVNNAPRDNTLVLGGLVFTDPSAVPLSGVEFTSDLNLRYTLSQSQKKRDFIALRWTENHVTFTDDAVPAGVEASDFSYRRLEGTVGRDFISGPDAPRQTVAVSFGRLWTSETPLADEVRVMWKQSYARPERRQFTWAASAGYSDRKDNARRSGVTADLSAQWFRPLEGGSALSWSTQIGRTDTDSAALTHTKAGFGVTYTHAKPILGGQGQLALGSSISQYDHAIYGAEARRDVKTSVSASLLMVDFDSYGFAPKFTLEASQTSSNVTRFETRNLGLQIGVQSLF
ncbi:hypothetical protein [Sulfitobacter sp.]